MKKICSDIVSQITKNSTYTPDDQEKMSYALAAISSDLSKACILCVVFGLLGHAFFFIIAFAYSTLLRITIGGFHFKKYWSCLIFTAFYYSVLLVLYSTKMQISLLTVLCVFCIIVLFAVAPITSLERQMVKGPNPIVFKLASLIISFVYLLLFISTKIPYTLIGLWVLTIQTILLLIAKGVNHIEKTNQLFM